MPSTDDRTTPLGFTSVELENSTPFDPEKRLRGSEGDDLLQQMLEVIAKAEGPRKRARKQRDAERHRTTVDAVLANLAAATLNRVDASRFIATSFNTNSYTGLPIALGALQAARDALQESELIEVAPGFSKLDTYERGPRFSRTTRIRATPTLVEIFEQTGIGRPSIKRLAERGLIHLKEPDAACGPEPKKVSDSRDILMRVNGRIAASKISLPDEAWSRIRAHTLLSDASDKEGRTNAGDDSAIVLRRIFSRSWDRGGRIYGGWWMHLPRSDRPSLTLDGEPVIELDYAQLHPTLLFARTGQPLDFDPYEIPGLTNANLRELGKRTFQRLINGRSNRSGMEVSMNAKTGDNELLPSGLTFQAYLTLFKKHLEPVSQWFSTGVGMELQREDSDLAIDVLRRMESLGITTLPIHDSFIAPLKNSEQLRDSMDKAFLDIYGYRPTIR